MKLNFQRGEDRKNPFCGGGMDVSWNYTILPSYLGECCNERRTIKMLV